MQKQKRSVFSVLNFAMAGLMVLLCASVAWAGPGERILYTFPGGSNGGVPYGTMIFDNTGSLYGLAAEGAIAGTIFKLTPSGTGTWTESVIYSSPNYSDVPGLNIVFDLSGNLYGTMPSSGTCGAVYQLVPSSGGSWTQNILFSFTDGATQGCYPESVIFDPATGSLYGIAELGGPNNVGAVFELTPVLGGGWNFDLIHSFGFGTDGSYPVAALTLDSSGNLYGTTYNGGSYGDGTVFRLTNGSEGWSESVLYNFTGGDNGFASSAGVVFDREGNLYGTTDSPGGADDVGNVYKLTPTKGDWAIHVIHTFTGGPDGANPAPFNLAIDGAGNLYGTTELGGLYNYGVTYKLSPSTGGKWKETVLHSFTNGADGANPDCGFVFDSAGNLYGSTNNGGADGYGVGFEVKP